MSSFVKTWVFETLLLVALAVPVFGAGCERQPDPPVEPRSAAPNAARALDIARTVEGVRVKGEDKAAQTNQG